MHSSQDLKELHYEYMLNSPLAKAMKSKIKALKRERKLLRRVVLELGENSYVLGIFVSQGFYHVNWIPGYLSHRGLYCIANQTLK